MQKNQTTKDRKALLRKAIEPMSIEKLRTYKGLEHLTDETAKLLLNTLNNLVEAGLMQINRLRPKGLNLDF